MGMILNRFVAAFFLLAGGTGFSHAQTSATPSPAPAAPTPAFMAMRDAFQLMQAGKLDDALVKVNTSIQLDPKNANAYFLKGNIYAGKKMWTEALQAYDMNQKLDPNNAASKFDSAEVKFMQKEYDQARREFDALKTNPEVDDLSAYKVFLCDLMGAHEDVAKRELDAFDVVGRKPSYYFANAAWSFFHHNIEDARSWLVSASHVYASQKYNLYATSLVDLGYLPLPPAPAK